MKMEDIYKKVDEAIKAKKDMDREIYVIGGPNFRGIEIDNRLKEIEDEMKEISDKKDPMYESLEIERNTLENEKEGVSKEKEEYELKVNKSISYAKLDTKVEMEKQEKILKQLVQKYKRVIELKENREENMNNMKNPSKAYMDNYEADMKKIQDAEKNLTQKLISTRRKIKDLKFIHKNLNINDIDKLSSMVEKNLPKKDDKKTKSDDDKKSNDKNEDRKSEDSEENKKTGENNNESKWEGPTEEELYNAYNDNTNDWVKRDSQNENNTNEGNSKTDDPNEEVPPTKTDDPNGEVPPTRTDEQQGQIDEAKQEMLEEQRRRAEELKNKKNDIKNYKVVVSAEDKKAYIYCGDEMLGKTDITEMSPSIFNQVRNSVLDNKEMKDRVKRVMGQRTALGLRHLDPAVVSVLKAVDDKKMRNELLDSYIKSSLDNDSKMDLVQYDLQWSNLSEDNWKAYRKFAKRLVKNGKLEDVPGLLYGKDKKQRALGEADTDKLQEEAEESYDKAKQDVKDLFNEKGVKLDTLLGRALRKSLNSKIDDVRNNTRTSEKSAKELSEFKILDEVSSYMKKFEEELVNVEEEMSLSNDAKEKEELKNKMEIGEKGYKECARDIYTLELDSQIECSDKLKGVLDEQKQVRYNEAVKKIEDVFEKGGPAPQISKLLSEYVDGLQQKIETNDLDSRSELRKFDPYEIISTKMKDTERDMREYKRGSKEEESPTKRQANKELFQETKEQYMTLVNEICDLECDSKIQASPLLDKTMREVITEKAKQEEKQNDEKQEQPQEKDKSVLDNQQDKKADEKTTKRLSIDDVKGRDDDPIFQRKLVEGFKKTRQKQQEFRDSLKPATPIDHQQANESVSNSQQQSNKSDRTNDSGDENNGGHDGH